MQPAQVPGSMGGDFKGGRENAGGIFLDMGLAYSMAFQSSLPMYGLTYPDPRAVVSQ